MAALLENAASLPTCRAAGDPGSGGFEQSTGAGAPESGHADRRSIASGDLNGDGALDAVIIWRRIRRFGVLRCALLNDNGKPRRRSAWIWVTRVSGRLPSGKNDRRADCMGGIRCAALLKR
jgi:hypothetical protein